MKSKSLLFLSLLLAGTGFLFVGCSDDDNEPEIPEITEGVFVLNNGKQNANNSTLSYYDLATDKVAADVFQAKNGRKLGDMGQDMVIYGSKVYIAVYGSNTIEITDRSGKSIKQMTPADGVDNPRYMTAYEGKVYVTFYTGFVARIDTATMTIEKKVKVGRYPEQIVAVNGNLYVANSGGLDYNKPIGYDKTVSVINVNSFTETQKLEVVLNPNNLAVTENGDVYVISMGDYSPANPNTLQRIDTKTNKVEKVEGVSNATVMAAYKNTLYLVYKQWGSASADFIKYDAAAKKVVAQNFITDGTNPDGSMYTVDVDPSTGNIYLSTSDYTVNGDMYIFSPAGKKLNKFEVGINPMGAFFVTNK